MAYKKIHASTEAKVSLAALAMIVLAPVLLANNHGCAFAFTPSLSHLSTVGRGPSPTSLLLSSKPQTSSSGTTDGKKKMSRPERKAMERKKKGQKKNGADSRARKEFKLHSNNISILTKDSSTADDVISAIKRAQNRHDVHDIKNIATFLVEEVDESFAYGYRGSLLSRLAVAALHMNEHESARKAIDTRQKYHSEVVVPPASSAIIRGLLRVHNVTDAFDVLDNDLAIPTEGPLDSPDNQDRIKYRALSISSIASRHFFEGEPCMAVKACKMLEDLGPIVRECGLSADDVSMPWTRIIDGAAQCESGRRDGSVVPCDPEVILPCNLVYAVLNAMTTFPSNNDDTTYEALSNALVRRTVFITGAVSMEGLPAPDRGEVVFVGRSNVGKSSLVNMITNRKSLAYTSKRPGKTQQFNFFAVNDKPGREKEVKYGDVIDREKDLDSFYMVDVPGFGFAKVPDAQRREWSVFLSEYLATRGKLRVVFHLIDARHGPIDEDTNIMKKMGETLPKSVKYVVVLTKADKNVKGPSPTNAGKVSKDILNKVRTALKDNNVGSAPILLTSAETRLGRDDVWRYMRLAAEV